MMYKLPYTPLNFDPIEHKYTDAAGREYISITTLLSRNDPFDMEKIAAQCIVNPRSKYYQMDKDEVIQKWVDSAPQGTIVHEAVESFINGEDVTDPQTAPLVEQFSRLRFSGTLLSEVRLHDERYLLAGTADIMEMCEDHIWLWDIKTSRARPDGKRMADSKKHKYALQLGIYKRLIEHRFNMPCNIGGILWFKDYTEHLQDTKLEIVQLEDASNEVDNILQERANEIQSSSETSL